LRRTPLESHLDCEFVVGRTHWRKQDRCPDPIKTERLDPAIIFAEHTLIKSRFMKHFDQLLLMSVRELSRRICLPRSTVHRHLTQSLRFTVRPLRWVPHFLTAEHKQIQVQMAIELLPVLSVQSTRQWHRIVTLDESWIYLFSEHDLMWTAPGEIAVDRERHTVQSPKSMLTVVWNPIAFHVLKALPKAREFNAQYYTNDVLVAISDWRRQTCHLLPPPATSNLQPPISNLPHLAP
jgi:hypothetical protein